MSIFQSVPRWRLTGRIGRWGLVISWRFATSPTRPSPVFEKATTEGVVRAPSALGMREGSPASSTATTELVVPRSMPTALDIGCSLGSLLLDSLYCSGYWWVTDAAPRPAPEAGSDVRIETLST